MKAKTYGEKEGRNEGEENCEVEEEEESPEGMWGAKSLPDNKLCRDCKDEGVRPHVKDENEYI
jgi:hypothetical protein